MTETGFQSVFYFIHCVVYHFTVLKLDCILNVGWGATLGWRWVRVAYQFKWWYGLRLAMAPSWAYTYSWLWLLSFSAMLLMQLLLLGLPLASTWECCHSDMSDTPSTCGPSSGSSGRRCWGFWGRWGSPGNLGWSSSSLAGTRCYQPKLQSPA